MRYILYAMPADEEPQAQSPIGMRYIVGIGTYHSDHTAMRYLVERFRKTHPTFTGWLGLYSMPRLDPERLVHKEQLPCTSTPSSPPILIPPALFR